jgi:hypothetical protein
MNDARASAKTMARLRLAVLLTGLAVALSIALLIKETAFLFTAFMFLGPGLLLAAVALLGWNILEELRAKKVL